MAGRVRNCPELVKIKAKTQATHPRHSMGEFAQLAGNANLLLTFPDRKKPLQKLTCTPYIAIAARDIAIASISIFL